MLSSSNFKRASWLQVYIKKRLAFNKIECIFLFSYPTQLQQMLLKSKIENWIFVIKLDSSGSISDLEKCYTYIVLQFFFLPIYAIKKWAFCKLNTINFWHIWWFSEVEHTMKLKHAKDLGIRKSDFFFLKFPIMI